LTVLGPITFLIIIIFIYLTQNDKVKVGKVIEEHYAVVINHPLQAKYPDSRINLIILKSQVEIIGGVSYYDFNILYNLDSTIIR